MRPVQVKTSFGPQIRAAFQSGTFIDQHVQAFDRQINRFHANPDLESAGTIQLFPPHGEL
jgi:hypothetical protein